MRRPVSAVLLFLFMSVCLYAAEISHVPVREFVPGEPVYFECLIRGMSGIPLQVSACVRPEGNRDYETFPMIFDGAVWSVRIPPESLPDRNLEYCILAEFSDGGAAASPDNAPFEFPYKIIYAGPGPDDVQAERRDSGTGETVQADIIILAPEPGSTVETGDFVAALSLFNVPDLDPASVRLEIDGKDYASGAQITPEIITLSPGEKALDPGPHTIRFSGSNRFGTVFEPVEWTFTLVGAAAAARSVSRSVTGRVSAEYRFEHIDGYNDNLLRLKGQFSGDLQKVRYGANGTWVSSESGTYQARNVAGFYVRSRYADIQGGTIYPELSRLTIFGNRINGLSAHVNLGFFGFTYLRGQLLRPVNGTAVYDSTGGEWILSSYTYGRKLTAIQPEFRIGRTLSWKISLMHARDDTASIRPREFIPGLEETADSVRYAGNAPMDNLLADNEVTLSLDEGRLIWTQNLALSMMNRDISGGVRDSVTIGDQTVSFTDIFPENLTPSALGYFFIINENTTLPVPVEVSGDLEEISMKPLRFNDYPSLAYWSALKLNYYKNYLTFTYRNIAPEFVSLAYPGLQSDVRLTEISDRIRMLRSRLILTLKYGRQQDNLLGNQKEYTTVTNSASSGLSLNPGPGLPSVSLAFRWYIRENQLDTESDTLTVSAADPLTDQRIRNENLYQMFSLTQPLETGGIPHTITLNYVRSSRTDKIPERTDGYISSDYSMTLWNLSGVTEYSGTFRQTLAWNRLANTVSKLSEYRYNTWSLKLEKTYFRERVTASASFRATFASGSLSFTQYAVLPELKIILFENPLLISFQGNKLNRSGEIRNTGRFNVKYSYRF